MDTIPEGDKALAKDEVEKEEPQISVEEKGVAHRIRVHDVEETYPQDPYERLIASCCHMKHQMEKAVNKERLSHLYRRRSSLYSPQTPRASKAVPKASLHDPVCHLLAMTKSGLVPDYDMLKWKTVAIVGLCGIGGLVAEMLVRSNVGRLVLFDVGVVEMHKMAHMFFNPKHVGMTKVQAARLRLSSINPNTSIKSYNIDVSLESEQQKICSILQRNGIPLPEEIVTEAPVDLVLSCLDNSEARNMINQLCLDSSLALMDIRRSPCSSTSTFRLVLPGMTACLSCYCDSGSKDMDAIEEKIGILQPATFPSCELINAGWISQSVMKTLLEFGQVVPFFQFDTLDSAFQPFSSHPNPNCDNHTCQFRQKQKVKDK